VARDFGTMEAVRGHLLLTNCPEDELTRPNIELALKTDRLLWLDLEGIDDEVLTLLREVFKIHPLAIEDALPLSFLTGFFGQNLGWMADRVGSLTAFLVFGIGTEVLAVIALFVMFRRRGWMGKKS
jgi:Mg2+ and Co2+ transporter CorA